MLFIDYAYIDNDVKKKKEKNNSRIIVKLLRFIKKQIIKFHQNYASI